MQLIPLRVPYPRPRTLSDPNHDFDDEHLSRILRNADNGLDWADYQALLGPHLPAGTYEESVYFLPLAFTYMLEHDDTALDLVAALVGFVSLNADRLEEDRLLEGARRNIDVCFAHWSSEFSVIHFDKRACEEKGWGLAYQDIVNHGDVICTGLCELVRFERHVDLAESFVYRLADHQVSSLRAAWFLALSAMRWEVVRPPKHPPIQALLTDRTLLEDAARMVVEERVEQEPSPTYWSDVLDGLGL